MYADPMQDAVPHPRTAGPIAACMFLFWCAPAAAADSPVSAPITGPTNLAQPDAPTPDGALPPLMALTSPSNDRLTQDITRAPPPPSHLVYFQYGVAFNSETVVSAGAMCRNPGIACVLGSGGGITVRGGWRNNGALYFGFAYELTKQDPNKLYRIALLQQARAEGRYYIGTARVTEPYLSASLGLSGYGNQWSIDTWGPGGSLGGGVEYQLSRTTVVGVSIDYRLLYFSRFTDTAQADRAPGVAQLFGLNLVLEQRDASLRAGQNK